MQDVLHQVSNQQRQPGTKKVHLSHDKCTLVEFYKRF